MATSFPDYYAILGIPKNASTEDIKQAYKRESLKTHPDRVANVSVEEKKAATEKFQAVADAYYELSDPQRRSYYDWLSSSKSSFERTSNPNASSDFSGMFANSATGNRPPGGVQEQPAQRPDADQIFGDVFEELLRPEVERHYALWTWLGTACGAGLGFVTGNVPGLVTGAYAGRRLGAIRDAKGKSVAAVFAG